MTDSETTNLQAIKPRYPYHQAMCLDYFVNPHCLHRRSPYIFVIFRRLQSSPQLFTMHSQLLVEDKITREKELAVEP
jgi:hypothetical protein